MFIKKTRPNPTSKGTRKNMPQNKKPKDSRRGNQPSKAKHKAQAPAMSPKKRDCIRSKVAKIAKRSKKSLDAIWSSIANLCLFSYKNDKGIEIFVSSEEERDAYGRGHESTFRDYPIFVPDAIVNRVAGKVGKARSEDEVLIAHIDGSHSFSGGIGCSAYSVFFQVGDRIAEYANTVYDNERRYGSTAAELMAAVVAIKVAISHGYAHVELRHDYTGVAFFAVNSNSNPNKASKMYWAFSQYEAFLACATSLIDITYTKIKSHSLDVGNEHADFLARTFSKRARIESDKIASRIAETEQVTPQMIAFCKNNDLGEITFADVDRLIVSREYQGHFCLSDVELEIVSKMIHGAATKEIMHGCNLTRKQLTAHRRSITTKLGMHADAAADTTIVKRTLNWLYFGHLNVKDNEGRVDENSDKEATPKPKQRGERKSDRRNDQENDRKSDKPSNGNASKANGAKGSQKARSTAKRKTPTQARSKRNSNKSQ